MPADRQSTRPLSTQRPRSSVPLAGSKVSAMPHATPLPKGAACQRCKSRKVRCDGIAPSCGACRRTARFEGRDPALVTCEYGCGIVRGVKGSKGKGKGKASALKETRDTTDLKVRIPTLSTKFSGPASASSSTGSLSPFFDSFAASTSNTRQLPLSLPFYPSYTVSASTETQSWPQQTTPVLYNDPSQYSPSTFDFAPLPQVSNLPWSYNYSYDYASYPLANSPSDESDSGRSYLSTSSASEPDHLPSPPPTYPTYPMAPEEQLKTPFLNMDHLGDTLSLPMYGMDRRGSEGFEMGWGGDWSVGAGNERW